MLSVIWIVLALFATALLLGWMYRDHIEQHFDAHVFTHVEELVSALDTDPDGQVLLLRQPTDPRFHRAGSGWYWQVMVAGQPLAKSPSLGDQLLETQGLDFDESSRVQLIDGPGGELLRCHKVHLLHGRWPQPVTVLATSPEIQITDDVDDFVGKILIAFAVLAIGLSIAVLVQVRVALSPLKAVRTALRDVQTGKTERLPRDYPDDIQPLVDEVNSLLDHNETLLKRARTQLADLAHSVKTPLTVIRNEARSMASTQGQLILDQAHVMSASIDHYLSRARISGPKAAFSYRTGIRPVVDDLRFALSRIYRDRDIRIELSSEGGCRFRGEIQDLEEMLGNLVDNACKWAQRTVVISCGLEQDRLTLTVEDDGPGIAEHLREEVMQRGRRLDESKPGHGHGLGIVQDIAELYGGALVLGDSPLGGLKAELNLPAAD
jgi:signal transduction histidine kinase